MGREKNNSDGKKIENWQFPIQLPVDLMLMPQLAAESITGSFVRDDI